MRRVRPALSTQQHGPVQDQTRQAERGQQHEPERVVARGGLDGAQDQRQEEPPRPPIAPTKIP